MTFEQYCNYMTAYNFKVTYSSSVGKSRGEIGNVYVTTMTDKKLFRFDCASNEYTGIRLYGEVQYINFSTICLILDLTNRFLTTPYEDRHIRTTYNLLVETNDNGSWFLGYIRSSLYRDWETQGDGNTQVLGTLAGKKKKTTQLS